MRYVIKYRWELADLLAGVMFTLAFSPFDYAFLAFIALGILFASWWQVTARRAALRGYLFGIGCFGLGVSWVFVSIHHFGGASIVVATSLTALFCAFWALFPALAGYFSVRIFGGLVRENILILPIIWILVEFIRGYWVLNGFPWLQTSYSQLDTIFSGFVPVVGVYGTGFLVALTVMIAIKLICLRQIDIALIALLGGIFFVGYLLQGYQWSYAIGDPIKVTLIQGNISQDKKWQIEFKQKTLDLYKKISQQHWDSQVIIWPETAIPAFLHEVDRRYLIPLEQEALSHQTDLVVSLPIEDRANGTYFNAVLTLGEQRRFYKKVHLLPFGEYMPLQPLSGQILQALNIALIGDFSAGEIDQTLLVAGGHKFITTICYEDVFAEKNASRLAEASYLINVSNDGWFGNSIEPHQHMQMARMRALEAGKYFLRATNTGLTAIVAPDGSISKQLPLFKTSTLTANIVPMAGLSPITKFGYLQIVIILAGTLAFIYLQLLYAKFLKK